MTKNVFKLIAFFVVGMVGGIFADQIFWPYFIERPLFYQYGLGQSPVYLTERKEVRIEENVALSEAIEKVEKTVVGIRTTTKTGKLLAGAGLIVSSDGLVVSLAELVPSGSLTDLFWEEKSPDFQLLKRDQKANLVLLKMDESNLPTVGFADLDKLRLGERVFLMAVVFEEKPAGRQIKTTKAVNEGIIASLSPDSFQTNIFETAGFKGSPLFNVAGEALGLNLVDAEGRIITIPVSKVRSFVGL